MKKSKSPILKYFLDTDAYKIHMQQIVYFKYSQVTVEAELICRGKNLLGKFKNLLIEQIQMMSSLYLSNDEYIYLLSFPYFKLEYLNWLKKFRFDSSQVQITNMNEKLHIHIVGLWKEVILWEVPILSLISEIVNQSNHPNINEKLAINYLHKKLLNFHNLSNDLKLDKLKIIDFGTRRRFSYRIHYSIINKLKNECDWFVGTSNYHLARIFNLKPFGTQAHEWFQAHQQISSILSFSQTLALNIWLEFYENHLNIALTDCINMDSFLKDFKYNLAKRYQGIRHDSGNPCLWGEKAIHHYKKLGIDPLTKTLLFSDNLNFNNIMYLYQIFCNRVQIIFGLGTNLTCDIPHVNALNIVIKLISCNGKPVAKISDSPGKTFCLDSSYMISLRNAFNIQ